MLHLIRQRDEARRNACSLKGDRTDGIGIQAVELASKHLEHIMEIEEERDALQRENQALKIASDDARHSLAQEIEGTLRTRGFWVPKNGCSRDLIGCVARALEKVMEERDEAIAKCEHLKSDGETDEV